METFHQIVSVMQEPIKKFVERVQILAGKNCLAVTGFGAIATSSFDPAKNSAKSLVVLERVDLGMLRELAKEGKKLGKARIAAPLIMTPAYIKGSLDTFPLEFLEIQQCNICLFGEDYFADVSFDGSHLRLQCERELKTILIAMRQGLLAAAGREKLVRMMEPDIVERLIRTLRGVLWLHDQKEYLSSIQVMSQVESQTNQLLPGIRGALHDHRHHGWEDFVKLYDEIDGLKTIIDRW